MKKVFYSLIYFVFLHTYVLLLIYFLLFFRRRLILFFGIVIICLTLTGSIFLSNYYGETMNTTSLFIEPPR